MILSDKHIKQLLKKKQLLIKPKPKKEDIKCNHINLHLSKNILKYKIKRLDLKNSKGNILTKK
jgi:deoxycytidine triphosphate deaminase